VIKLIPILIGGVTLFASNANALEFSAVAETPLTTSEATAFDNSISLAKGIEAGSNEDAMEEASVECPNDNHPSFVVDRIKANSYWLSGSTGTADKRFSGEVHYTIKCTFTHGKQR